MIANNNPRDCLEVIDHTDTYILLSDGEREYKKPKEFIIKHYHSLQSVIEDEYEQL